MCEAFWQSSRNGVVRFYQKMKSLKAIVDGLNYVSPLLTALATAGIVWIAYWQWDALVKTDRTLREGQRPFVYLEKVDWHYAIKEGAVDTMMLMGVGGYVKNTKNIVEITIHMTNSGAATAASVAVHYTCTPLTDNPSEPFDSFKWDESKAVRQPIGPKQTIEFAPCAELMPQDITANAMGLVHRYIIGEARYDDAGGHRWTQFAQQLRFFGEDVTNTKS